MFSDNIPVKQHSIEEITAKRDLAIEQLTQAVALMVSTDRLYQEAAQTPYSLYSGLGHSDWYHLKHDEHDTDHRFIAKLTREFDKHAWRYLLDMSGLRNLMDADTMEAFQKQLDEDTPALTVKRIHDTFLHLYEQKEQTFRRGLVNVFRALDYNAYKTNQPFCIGKKIILDRAFSEHGYWNHYSKARERLDDLDRIFHVLDNKEPRDHRGGAASLVYQAKSRGEDEVSTAYMHCRLFLNGNVHIKFLRLDLVTKANLMIAGECGQSLPDAR